MNMLLIIAGLLSAFVVIGHFKFGINWYLKPMLDTDLELIPKATMQSVFHYVSVYLVLSTIVLLNGGFSLELFESSTILIQFIGINFLAFTGIQIFYSFKNKVEKPLIKMFQWTMFLPIGILCLLSV